MAAWFCHVPPVDAANGECALQCWPRPSLRASHAADNCLTGQSVPPHPLPVRLHPVNVCVCVCVCVLCSTLLLLFQESTQFQQREYRAITEIKVTFGCSVFVLFSLLSFFSERHKTAVSVLRWRSRQGTNGVCGTVRARSMRD